MGILPYLSLLILSVCLLQEYVSSWDDEAESSIFHLRRQKLDYPALRDRNHPWAVYTQYIEEGRVRGGIGRLSSISLGRPTIVKIMEDDEQHKHEPTNAYAIHPFLAVASASCFERLNEYNLHKFRVESRGLNGCSISSFIKHVERNATHGLALIETKLPIVLFGPQDNGFYRNLRPSDAAVEWVDEQAFKVILERLR
ncbi:uncharacterized protein LOC117167984 [Belonocnema kinseyi]|uniref:uncharacterized protein LOC117167984 n=1 Tax=Belonocnema kinseyi TaxID=2817044 RepID=UPI00143D7F3E|nr:uncharacterized protein LOC117167984 [Belonocnema kinseyi]